MTLHTALRLALTSSVLALSAACQDATAPLATPAEAAGSYALETVIGRGPATGAFTLTADGRAERRVRHAVAGQFEEVSTGTFAIDDAGISFLLIQPGMPGVYTWPVRGEWRGSSFTIHYPDPADGPDIVETYRRR